MQNSNKNAPIFLFASGRSRGNTWQAMQYFINGQSAEIIDLSNFHINYFEYENTNKNDDFLKILDHILKHQKLICVTPIYWYSMSARMKVFFERLSEIFINDKNRTKLLQKIKLYVICSYGNDAKGKQGFAEAFENTAKYCGIKFGGCLFFHAQGGGLSISSKNEQLYQSCRNEIWND